MKIPLLIILALFSHHVVASYNTEVRIFDADVTIPGDCTYLVDKVKFVCRTTSGFIIVSFPSIEATMQNYNETSSSNFGDTSEHLKLTFAEEKSDEQYQHFATTVESQGVFVLQYTICSIEGCVATMSGSPHSISKLLNQLVNNLILFPLDLNDL